MWVENGSCNRSTKLGDLGRDSLEGSSLLELQTFGFNHNRVAGGGSLLGTTVLLRDNLLKASLSIKYDRST